MKNIAKKLTLKKQNRKGGTLTIEIFIVLIVLVIGGIIIFGSIADKMDQGGEQIIGALESGLARNGGGGE